MVGGSVMGGPEGSHRDPCVKIGVDEVQRA